VAIPEGVPRRTVSAGLGLVTPGGTPYQGRITFTGPNLVTVGPLELVLGGGQPLYLVDGAGTIELVPNDLDGMSPSGWTYTVQGDFTNAPGWTRYLAVPSGTGPLQLAELLDPDPAGGEYAVLVPQAMTEAYADAGDATTLAAAQAYTDQHGGGGGAPSGPAGGALAGTYPNPSMSTATVAAFDPAGTAGAVGNALTAHAGATTGVHGIADTAALITTADARLTNSRTPSGAAGGDLSGTYPNPGVAKVGGVSVSGTPSTGWVPTATSGTAAAWQALPATPTAASTVAGETAYGQTSAVGAGTAYARSDHTHGTPSLTGSAPATTQGIGTAAAVGVATSPARADHVHPTAAAGAPVASAVGDTAVTGVATTFAASDHVHAREGFGAVTAQTAFAAGSSNGAAATVARSDHTHGTPTLPAASTSASGVVQLDGTAGDIQPLGIQAAGAVGKAADAGHVHAMPRLDQAGAPTAAVGMGSQKITSLANGSSAQDGAAFGQIPVAGTGGTNYAAGNDSRLSNARTPTAHASTHATGSTDPMTAASIGALDLTGGAVSGNLTVAGHALRAPQVADHGLRAWAFDPRFCGATAAVATAGTLFLSGMFITESFTATALYWGVAVAPTGQTAAQNFVGLYDSSGNLLTSVGVDSDTATTGLKTATISVALTPGTYWAAFLFNAATTAPQLPRCAGAGGSPSLINVGLSGAAQLYASNGTGRTSLPSTITMASNAAATGYWAGIK
jgi:hypothetical protein